MDVTSDKDLDWESLEIIAVGSNPFSNEWINVNVAGFVPMPLCGLYFSIMLVHPQGTLLYFLARARQKRPCNSVTVKYLVVPLDDGELWDQIAKSCSSHLSEVESLVASVLIKYGQELPKETQRRGLQSARET